MQAPGRSERNGISLVDAVLRFSDEDEAEAGSQPAVGRMA